jgi:hypothetical protein
MSHEFYSGAMAESELTGEILHKKDFGDQKYISYRQAETDVENGQPCDPTAPEKRFASDFHASVAEQICPNDYSRLQLFTAVGSALDYYHGIDGYFRYIGEKGKLSKVTFDLTKNPDKQRVKAEVLIVIPEMSDPEFSMKNPEYMDWINEITRNVLKIIEAKQKEK